MLYLISYDILDSRNRLQVVNYIKDHGHHLQKGIFMVECDHIEAERIYQEVLRLLNRHTDRLLMMPVCSECWSKAMMTGNYHLQVEDQVRIV